MQLFIVGLAGLAALVAAAPKVSRSDLTTVPVPAEYAQDFCPEFITFCRGYFSSDGNAECMLSGSTAQISCPDSDANTVFDAQIAFFNSPYYHEKQDAYVVDLPDNFGSIDDFCKAFKTQCDVNFDVPHPINECSDAGDHRVNRLWPEHPEAVDALKKAQ